MDTRGWGGGEGVKKGIRSDGGIYSFFDIKQSIYVNHTDRINVHRVLSINSMYSRSDSQKRYMMKCHILGNNTGWQGG